VVPKFDIFMEAVERCKGALEEALEAWYATAMCDRLTRLRSKLQQLHAAWQQKLEEHRLADALLQPALLEQVLLLELQNVLLMGGAFSLGAPAPGTQGAPGGAPAHPAAVVASMEAAARGAAGERQAGGGGDAGEQAPSSSIAAAASSGGGIRTRGMARRSGRDADHGRRTLACLCHLSGRGMLCSSGGVVAGGCLSRSVHTVPA
jgi:AcrR family transcriptional regulator